MADSNTAGIRMNFDYQGSSGCSNIATVLSSKYRILGTVTNFQDKLKVIIIWAYCWLSRPQYFGEHFQETKQKEPEAQQLYVGQWPRQCTLHHSSIQIRFPCGKEHKIVLPTGLDKVLREKRKLFIHSVGMGTINGLLDELLEKRVLNQEEMEKVRDENATVMDKARALIDSVIRKGPQACQICISHICEDDCHLAGALGLSSGQQSGNFPKTQDSQTVVPAFPAPQAVQDNPARPRGSLKLCPPEIVQKIWNEKSAEIYPIIRRSLTRTRLALIICNTEFDNLSRRDGAEADIINMTVLLEGLGYSVAVKENLTALGMTTELKAFAVRPEHQTSDSTFLVFMSHGIRDGICGKKFSQNVPDILEVNTIFQIFNTWNCPSLRDKPKVIIIQACRGENEGVVWLKDSVEASGNSSSLAPEDFEDDAIRKAHVEKDFIAFCSSTPDNVSWRHPRWGSLFILNLIETLQEYAWSCDLEEIFRKVRLSFEPPNGRVQMPTTERVTLTRCFYLFPGY